MEEDTAPPRRNDTLLLSGMRATRSTSMRFTEPQGRRRSRPSHLVDRPVHPRHLHTLCGTPHMASSYYRRRRRNSLSLRRGLWQTSISTIKLSTHWFRHRHIICWGTLDGCNSPTGCRQTPTRSLPWKS
jgi:hypothetical protein